MSIERISSSNGSRISEMLKTKELATGENPAIPVDAFSNQTAAEESLDEALKVSPEKMESLVHGLNEFLTPMKTSLKFQLHEKLNEYYVTIIDEKTKEVVREIPPKKMLDMYAAMTEFMGLIVDKKI